MIKDAQFNLQI